MLQRRDNAQVWAPRHRGTLLPNGLHTNAPSSVMNAISAISMAMKNAGRTAPWHGESTNSNPCDSHEVRTWKVGFLKQQAAAGYVVKGAKEMTAGKVHALLTHLLAKQSLGTHMHQAMAARDGLAFSMLWSTCMRGINAC